MAKHDRSPAPEVCLFLFLYPVNLNSLQVDDSDTTGGQTFKRKRRAIPVSTQSNKRKVCFYAPYQFRA